MTLPWAARRRAPVAALLCALVLSAGCAMFPWATTGTGFAPAAGSAGASPTSGSAPASVFDPVGRYELTMSSETMVSEGTMEIRGEPGRYTGMIAVGSVGARVVGVEAAADHMIVRATTSERTLILRLARDEDFFSGNWILGGQRGTIVGRKRPDQSSAGPVSISRSFRPPHSDQDPS